MKNTIEKMNKKDATTETKNHFLIKASGSISPPADMFLQLSLLNFS